MQQTSPLKTVLVSTLATALLIFVAQYLIGKQEIRIGIAIIPILPMLFAVIIGMIVSAKPSRIASPAGSASLARRKRASAARWWASAC